MKYTSQAIYAILQKRILRGVYSPDHALPSERDLSEELCASRAVMRSALKRLVDSGYLEMDSPRKRRISSTHTTNIFNAASRLVGIFGSDYAMPGPEDKLIISQRRIRGVYDRLGELGYSPLNIFTGWFPEMISEYLSNYKTCGLIYLNDSNAMSPSLEDFVCNKLCGRLPLVTFGDTDNVGRQEFTFLDRCGSDHGEGPRLLLEYLVSRGCKRFLWYFPFYNHASLRWHAERQHGYEEAARMYGVELIPLTRHLPISNEVTSAENFEHLARMTADAIAPMMVGSAPIQAILCESDVSVAFFNRALRQLGKQPNTDVLVAGYDHYYKLCKSYLWEQSAPAATIDKGDLEIGRICVDLLMKRLKSDEKALAPFTIKHTPRLIIPEN